MSTRPPINRTGASAGRLDGDSCDRDWIWDRDVETASPADQVAASSIAWDSQVRHLAGGSPFYTRKFKAAGVGDSNSFGRNVRYLGVAQTGTITFSSDCTAVSTEEGDRCIEPTREVRRPQRAPWAAPAPCIAAFVVPTGQATFLFP